MFGSIGSYIYDRRRGLLKSAGVIGTLYLAGKYAIQRLEEIKEAVITERNAKEKYVAYFQLTLHCISTYSPSVAISVT
jgi:peroxin-3